MRFCSQLVLALTLAGSANVLAAGSITPAASAQPDRAIWVVRVDPRTGRLVRSILAPKRVSPANAADAQTVRELINETANAFEVSPLLVDSVIQVESNYDPYAVSPKGAEGLMQLMPATARRFGVTNSFDPRQNIEAGVRYLKLLKNTFQDDRLAIAAYNAGEKAVATYGDVPPYPETKSYVEKVGRKYGQAQHAAKQRSQSSQAAPAPAEEGPRHIVQYTDAQGRLHIETR
jgi:soluble lytic murein transglycosylase-like protein